MNGLPGNGEPRQTFLRRLAVVLPVLSWLPAYQRQWLRADLLAGVTLAAYAIPVAMAYATLAGLPPQSGLYCYLFGGMVYALFASSRHLSIGPTAAISLMVAGVAGSLAGGDPARHAGIAALTAALVALFCIASWLLRLDSVVNFISEAILLGFKAGAALSIAMTQLPKLFGVPDGTEGFFRQLAGLISHLGETNPFTLTVGLASLALLFAGMRFFPGRPMALAVVVLSILTVTLTDLTVRGVSVVGTIPHGLPPPALPHILFSDLGNVLELAFACFLLSYIESISAARTFALKYRYSVEPRQELLALGAANLAAALGQGYPVGGGLSQSAVNERAGARTPLALVFASATLTLVLLFLTGLLQNLPTTVLAAVVIAAVSGFVNLHEFKRLRRISRLEFTVALVAFAGVLCFGILKGVAISVVASILLLLRQEATPHVAILGRIPGTPRFSDIERHPDNERFPGLFLFRVEAPLVYFNVAYVARTVIERVHTAPEPVRLVICDLSTSPYVDSSGGRMLALLEGQLALEGIRFRVAEAHAEARDMLRAEGVEKLLGGVSRLTAISDLVDDFLGHNDRRSEHEESA